MIIDWQLGANETGHVYVGLGFARNWISVAATTSDGAPNVYCSVARQNHTPGSAAAQNHTPGTVKAKEHTPGSVVGGYC